MKTCAFPVNEPRRFSVRDCWVEEIERKRDKLILTFDDDGFYDEDVRCPGGRMVFVLNDASDCIYVKKNIIRPSHTREKYIPFDKFCRIVRKNRFCIHEVLLGYHSGDVEIRGFAPFDFELELSAVKEIRFEYD